MAAEIPYVPPRIQKFAFNPNLPPMKPIDLYQLYSKPAPQTPAYLPPIQPPVNPTKTSSTLYPESSQTENIPSGGGSAHAGEAGKSCSNTGVVVAVVVIVLAAVVVVGFVVYKKFFANKNVDSSEVIEAPPV